MARSTVVARACDPPRSTSFALPSHSFPRSFVRRIRASRARARSVASSMNIPRKPLTSGNHYQPERHQSQPNLVMSEEASPSRPAGLDPEEYRKKRQDIEYHFNKSRQLLCADFVALRKSLDLAIDAVRRMNASADSLKDLGIEYNSTYSSMGNEVNAAWATHPMYDRLIAIVIQQAEQRYEIGRGLVEWEYYKCHVTETKTRIKRRHGQQAELKAKIESLTAGKATLTLDCICQAEAPDPVLDNDVLSVARKYQHLTSHFVTNDVFEWFRMQQKLADNTQIGVPEENLCFHGREGPRRPTARTLSTPQLPSLELLPPPPQPAALVLSTAAQRLTYRSAAIDWRESVEFQAILDGQYSQMKINSFPDPPVGNLIPHSCPPDPFWPFHNCCRCDVRELLFWQSDFPKCLPLFRRAFVPLRFAVECSKETRDEMARFAKAIHTTVEGIATELMEIDEQGITLLK